MNNSIDLIIGTFTASEEIIELEKALTKYLPTLKPGGHIAITNTPQLYDYVGMALRLQNIEIRDMIMWLSETYGSTPTILGRKLFKGTVANNVITCGTGGINIDGCRVPYQENEPDKRVGTDFVSDGKNLKDNKSMFGNTKYYAQMYENKGRYPANMLVEHTPYILSQFPHTKSGKMGPQHTRTTDGSPHGVYGKFDVNHPLSETYGDSGSASRFFNQVDNINELKQHLLKLLLPEQGTYIDITKEIK